MCYFQYAYHKFPSEDSQMFDRLFFFFKSCPLNTQILRYPKITASFQMCPKNYFCKEEKYQ